MKINFALFKNNKKEREGQPDYRFWDKETGAEAAAWIKRKNTSTGTLTYLSVEYKDGSDAYQPDKQPAADDLDDSLPF